MSSTKIFENIFQEKTQFGVKTRKKLLSSVEHFIEHLR
jgi:hypothetical protein